jgi:beta-lactamase class D
LRPVTKVIVVNRESSVVNPPGLPKAKRGRTIKRFVEEVISFRFSGMMKLALFFVFFYPACTVNNVKFDDSLKQYFEAEQADGCFAMYDNARNQFTIYNLQRDTTRYTPASTFKIVNALVGIQTGRVTDDSTIIRWDGIERKRPEWNQDLSVYRAFRYSSVPHFQAIAREVGKDTMQKWLDSLKYGNMKIGSRVDSFWLDNSLKISADEQLWLVKKLYFRQLPFRASAQESVKKMMLQENNANYQLAYKTGWGTDEKGNSIGWLVGWVEENRHPYFFVMNYQPQKADADIRTISPKILDAILKKLGFFQGKM